MKDVVGYEGLYKVSEDGQVWSVKREHYISQRLDRDGYLRCNLYKAGKIHTVFIHRIVAEAYIPNPEGKETVNHRDENKSNNCVSNLEWMTRTENCQYGTGIARSAAKRKKQVRCIETGIVYPSVTEAAAALDGHGANISACCRGKAKTYKNLHWEYVKGE